MNTDAYVIGVDVGTGSARAGLFDAQGHRLAVASRPIEMWRPKPGHAEQSSRDIWSAACQCVRECLNQSHVAPAQVAGISFDATCSLVVLDGKGASLPVNVEGEVERDIVVWMDQRAVAEAEEINAGDYEVLKYVGGRISPEMQTPKLLWLKRYLPTTWAQAGHFFDLADWLTWKASGDDSRSLCTVVCKWTYLGGENRWDEAYFRAIGLEDALPRIGTKVGPIGAKLGTLTPQAAEELGLTTACAVGQGLIDAHAGGLGLMGGVWHDSEGTPLETLENALALIGGTSNCHMAVSREPRFVSGVWGPYWGAMVPDMWLNEGGQTTAGSAIDYAIADHANAPALRAEAGRANRSVYELLNDEIAKLGGSPTLTRDLHVLPDFLGNRSPYADPGVRGLIDGITLDESLTSHALRYYATLQGVAYGTRNIVSALEQNGYSLQTMLVTGGGTKNPLWMQEHADALGLTLLLPEEPEAVLLGVAVVAATAAGLHSDIRAAMKAMSRIGAKVAPRPEFRAYHEAKFGIFQRLYEEQRVRRTAMQDF